MELEEATTREVLPLRVLVVERDDSTRSVISALLRKCSYKVTSVSDGLEAWEALKEKPQSIDLILTEVDLPSISGFTLLTLVMDHDICKRIPVIMMSSQDSISTVLKCMLKGAADFLIKPIRKNELQNIWQHVWRRQISTAENKSLSTVEECQVIGATSEKTAVSSPSNVYNSSGQDAECKEAIIISKMEGEDAMDEKKTNNDITEECMKIDKESGLHDIIGAKSRLETLCNETRNLAALGVFDDGGNVNRAKFGDSVGPKFQGEESNGAFELPRRDVLFREPLSLAAINLIGSFGAGKGECETSKFIVGKSNSACGPQLELSLQGSNSSGPRRTEADEGRLLNHSSASAFSRYNSGNRFRVPLTSYSIVNSKAQRTVNESKKGHKSYLKSAFSHSGDNCIAAIDEQSEQSENTSATSIELVWPRKRSKNLIEAYGCPDPSLAALHAHACQILAWSTCITGKSDQTVIHQSNSGSSKKQKGVCADKMNAESPSDKHEKENKSVMEDYIGTVAVTLGSLMRDSINCSSMCTEIYENTKDIKLVNDSGFSSATVPESTKDTLSCGGPNRVDTLRSREREAALIKFRQKREERCFEKKVRYHSRKQLAEQRPRIKGQFVRQVQTDRPPQPANAN